MIRTLLASLFAAAVMALVPAAALAQDAGCSQYCDPLTKSPNPTPRQPAPAPASNSPSAAPSTTQSGQATQSSSSPTTTATPGIPRTGFPVGFLMFAGALCLTGGVALRRATESARA